MARYEVEIKGLLGEQEMADALKARMCALDPACVRVSQNKQLNHYFKDGDIALLFEKTKDLFSEPARERFAEMVERGSSFSVRTRQKDDEVLLVVKASLDGGTSANTVSRMEFEEPVPVSLAELDALVEEAWFVCQAKWSREREEYAYKGATVCLDRNAGYGYLAEFEKMADDENILPAVRSELETLMAELGVQELPQDRLERMFAHYNEHWPEYYGTDKTFIIE